MFTLCNIVRNTEEVVWGSQYSPMLIYWPMPIGAQSVWRPSVSYFFYPATYPCSCNYIMKYFTYIDKRGALHQKYPQQQIQWSPYIRPQSPAATPLIWPDLPGTDSFLYIFIYPSPTATPLTRPAATVLGSQTATKPLSSSHLCKVTLTTEGVRRCWEAFFRSVVILRTKRGADEVLRDFFQPHWTTNLSYHVEFSWKFKMYDWIVGSLRWGWGWGWWILYT